MFCMTQQFLAKICKQYWKKFKQRVRNKSKIDKEDFQNILNTTASVSSLTGDPQNPQKPTSSVIEWFTKSKKKLLMHQIQLTMLSLVMMMMISQEVASEPHY